MNRHDLDDLKAEFDKFVREKCTVDESGNPVENDRDAGDAVDEEPVPAFVDELENKLLAPALSGVYLSRVDIKRISQALDESLPIKERNKMIKALFRHTISKAWLRGARRNRSSMRTSQRRKKPKKCSTRSSRISKRSNRPKSRCRSKSGAAFSLAVHAPTPALFVFFMV
ncbi:MAG: hypothetical protein P8Y51_05010 [Campylobacterales bacterium]